MKIAIKDLIQVFLLLLFVGALNSCVEDTVYDLDNIDESINVKYELAAPVATSTFAIEEVLEQYVDEIVLHEEADGLLYFDYVSGVKNINFPTPSIREASTKFIFKNEDSDIPTPISISGGSVFEVARSKDAMVAVSNGGVDTIYFASGNLEMTLQSGYVTTSSVSETFVVTIPNLTKNGVALSTSVSPENGAVAKVDVAGYTLRLTERSPGQEAIPINVTYQLSSNLENSTTLDQEASLELNFSDDLAIDLVAAYLAEPVLVNQSITVSMDLFKNGIFDINQIDFKNPSIYLDVINNFNIPVNLEIKEALFEKKNSTNKETVGLGIEEILPAAKITGIGDGLPFSITPEETRVTIDSESTPVLPSVIKQMYSKVTIDSKLTVDAKYTDPSSPFFFNPESEAVGLTVTTHLPLWLKLTNLVHTEEMEIDMDSYYSDAGEDTVNFENVDFAYVMVNILNSNPFNASAQLYLEDANNVLIDSLFSDGATSIEGIASHDPGSAFTPVASTIKVEITGDKAAKWRNVTKGILKVKASSVGNDYVKFYQGQKMTFSVGVYAKGTYQKEQL